jgi:preprotein translocase subunit SecG
MEVFITTLHVILCLLLVLIILMQPGKGGDVSSAFGGGSSSQLFGAAGPGNFLTRGTGVIAGLFMVTSIALALYSGPKSRAGDEILDEGEEGSGFGVGTTAPAAPDAAPSAAPVAPQPTEPVAPTGTVAPAAVPPATGTP